MERGWLFLFLILAIPSLGQTFRLDDEGSKIGFSVRNFGLTVSGRLRGLEGSFKIDEADIAKSRFAATVQVKTIDTGVALRDKHLRQKNYFDVENYPVIRISSGNVSRRGKEWVADAEVTIKKVTKRISIRFTIERDQSRVILRSNFTINRLDFDLGGKSFSMDDSAQVQLEIAATSG